MPSPTLAAPLFSYFIPLTLYTFKTNSSPHSSCLGNLLLNHHLFSVHVGRDHVFRVHSSVYDGLWRMNKWGYLGSALPWSPTFPLKISVSICTTFLNSYHGRRSFFSFPDLFFPAKTHPSIFEFSSVISFSRILLFFYWFSFVRSESVNKFTPVWKSFTSLLCYGNFSFLSFHSQPKLTAVSNDSWPMPPSFTAIY